MTIEEIFIKLLSHMKNGCLYHEEFVKAYNFLGLWGFAKCQEYHEFEELQSYYRLMHYYSTHYFKLLQLETIEQPNIIPNSWYKYMTQSIDTNSKLNAIKELMKKWVEWERITKKLYQSLRRELTEINELDAARKLDELIHDVSTELHDVEKFLLKLETIGYDPITIIEWSDSLYKKYKKKLGW